MKGGTLRGARRARAYLALKLDLFVVVVWNIPLGKPGLASGRESQRAHSDKPGSLGKWRPNSLPVLDQDKGQHLGRLWLAVGRGDEARMSGSSFLSREVGCGV